MEHVFSMQFARGASLQQKIKIPTRKKIVRERYVFAGPMRSALPLPLGRMQHAIRVYPVGHVDNVDSLF
jgi:hypothetical protein